MWLKYDCAKADELKRERLGDFCFFLAEAWVKQNSYAFDRLKGMYDCNLYDCQNAESVKQVVFEYSEEKQLARVAIAYDCNGQGCYSITEEKQDLNITYLYFPLWMLKQASKKGIEYVSWRQVYTGK